MLNFDPEIDYSDGEIADYLAEKREGLKMTKNYKPDAEASGAMILAEAMRNQRL